MLDLGIPKRSSRRTVFMYMGVLALLWLIVLGISLYKSLTSIQQNSMALVLEGARALYEKDVLYRRWNASLGGIYAAVSDKVQPNPYLKVPHRDVRTEDGLELTLINPAYMTRQVHEIQKQMTGSQGHITSLIPIRPENAADRWETQALTAFERGDNESTTIETMKGGKYFRMMRPLKVEESCLKCHAEQGYKVGQVRGGISVSVPLTSTEALIAHQQQLPILVHLGFAGVGCLVLFLGGRSLTQQIGRRELAELELRASHDILLDEVEMRRRTEQQLLRVQAAVEDATDSVIILDTKYHVLYLNSAFTAFFGKDITALNQSGEHTLFDIHDLARRTFNEALQGINSSQEALMRNTSGQLSPVLVRTTAVRDSNNAIQGVLRVCTDITERKKVEEELRRIAAMDGLTHVANRRCLEETFSAEWRRAIRHGRGIALIMLDIDYFKPYNDHYGHIEGDECLKSVAQTLNRQIKRPGDLLARYGGEEFSVLLPDTDIEGATALAHNLRAAVEALQIPHKGSSVSEVVTVSVGVAATMPKAEDNPAQLRRRADDALYQAKAQGRNCVVTL